MTWGQEYLRRHMELQMKNDIDTLLDEHYHDHAELVTFEFVKKGKAAIGEYLKTDQPGQAGRIVGVEQIALAESDDVLILTAVVTSEKMGRFVARDAFYLTNGKILKHIALTLPPGKDVKSEWD